MLNVWNNMSIRFLWLGKLNECSCFITESSVPFYISDLSITSVNKEYFTHFVRCHSKVWFRPATQAYTRQCKHRRLKCRLNNASWRTTQAAIKRRKNKSLKFRMIWEFYVSIYQVWTSCLTAYACTCVFKQRMRVLLILAFASQVWTRLS